MFWQTVFRQKVFRQNVFLQSVFRQSVFLGTEYRQVLSRMQIFRLLDKLVTAVGRFKIEY
jgi:hypothetical protein